MSSMADDPRWMRTDWRPGSRRAFAYCLNEMVSSKRMLAEFLDQDGRGFEVAADLKTIGELLKWFSEGAVAAGYITEDQAGVILGPDTREAAWMVRTAIWDFEAGPPGAAPFGAPLTEEQLAVLAGSAFVLHDAPLTREQAALPQSDSDSDPAWALMRELKRNKVYPDLPGNEAPHWNAMDWPTETQDDDRGTHHWKTRARYPRF
jgi:hypothetical protein